MSFEQEIAHLDPDRQAQAKAMRAEWGKGWHVPVLWRIGPSPADRLLEQDATLCPQCLDVPGGCAFCHHTGRVCPTCRGARYLRVAWEPTRPFTAIQHPQDRCRDCSVASAYDHGAELRAIATYLHEHGAP